jgi:hypothetical protein
MKHAMKQGAWMKTPRVFNHGSRFVYTWYQVDMSQSQSEQEGYGKRSALAGKRSRVVHS